MELFIRIVDGQPFEHPIFGDNFRQAFPTIDVNNLPSEFARFERIEQPYKASFYEVEECTYQWVGSIVKDVWTVRPMTSDERIEKLNEYKDLFNNTVQILKTTAQQKIDTVELESVKQAWTTHLQELNSWVLLDVENPQIPMQPLFDANGNVLQLQLPQP